jgi:hypothetical protein
MQAPERVFLWRWRWKPMSEFELIKDGDWPTFASEIMKSNRPEIEKLAEAFGWITDRIVDHAVHEIEVARALGDSDEMVKHQIKMETVKHARRIFRECHLLATGRKVWDE